MLQMASACYHTNYWKKYSKKNYFRPTNPNFFAIWNRNDRDFFYTLWNVKLKKLNI
jgi:hypothetical protein